MDASDTSRLPFASLSEAPTLHLATSPEAQSSGAPPATEAYEQCDECGAPVDKEQRYCVSCGAHRRHVDDPAARYLSQATARSRSSRAAAVAQRTPRSGGRARGLGTALILALIPVVAAVGVIAGRSSNNSDAQLIQALAKHQAPTVTTTVASSTAGSAGTTTSTARHTTAKSAKSGRSKKHAATTRNTAKASSTTQFGSVSQIAGSKPTAAQKQQGAQDTQKVQKSKGQSYVDGQSSLPGTVVVP
jgi:hypothetical protein